jgi:hypothetical protein
LYLDVQLAAQGISIIALNKSILEGLQKAITNPAKEQNATPKHKLRHGPNTLTSRGGQQSSHCPGAIADHSYDSRGGQQSSHYPGTNADSPSDRHVQLSAASAHDAQKMNICDAPGTLGQTASGAVRHVSQQSSHCPGAIAEQYHTNSALDVRNTTICVPSRILGLLDSALQKSSACDAPATEMLRKEQAQYDFDDQDQCSVCDKPHCSAENNQKSEIK